MNEHIFKAGNKWVRIDLHLHTISDSEFKYQGKNFINDYIEALKTAEIRIGAITNHNKFNFDEYIKLKEGAEKNNIWLLPGVELELNEGKGKMHVLIIFNDKDLEKDNQFINDVIARQFDLHTKKTNKKLEEVLNDLDELKREYLLIFAHVDSEKGFFKALKPANYITWIEKGYFRNKIVALQNINNSSRSIFENELRKVYKDQWQKYRPAYVSFLDPKCIEDILTKDKKTYIKIGAFNFSALKFAFLNHELRIKNELPAFDYPRIISLEIKNGNFIENQTIEFNPSLNTLIGIRGSGKSTIIEVLRWILEKKPLEGSDENYKNSLVHHALGNGGEVILKIKTKDAFTYMIKKGFMDYYPVILDQNGEKLDIKNISGLFDVIYYGQKDLSEITKTSIQQLSLIDEFIKDKLTLLKSKEKTIKNKLSELIKEIHKLEKTEEKVEELEDELNTLREKIRIFKEKGIDNLLKEQTDFDGEKEKFDFVLSSIQEQITKLKELEDFINQSFDIILEYNFEFLGVNFRVKLKNLREELLKEFNRIFEIFVRFKESLEGEEFKIISIKENELKEKLSKFKKEIDSRLDTNFYIKTSRKIQQLEIKIRSIVNKKKLLKEKEKAFEEQIETLNNIQRRIYEERKKFVEQIEKRIKFLRVKIEFRGDKESFTKHLENILKGSGIRKNKIEKLSSMFSDGYSLYKAVKTEESQLIEVVGTNDFYKIKEKIWEVPENLVTEVSPDKVIIEYKLNELKYKPLEKLSIGQRAAALLAMILLHQNKPVIIDQPEDDIDNSTIYEGIIKTILERKDKNQFIFATHNSNVVVLGDSDNVLVCKNEGEKLALNSGSIDREDIQNEIMYIMEGGKEAFEKRKIIYKLWG